MKIIFILLFRWFYGTVDNRKIELPIVSGNFFALVIAPPLQKRQAEWMNEVAHADAVSLDASDSGAIGAG